MCVGGRVCGGVILQYSNWVGVLETVECKTCKYSVPGGALPLSRYTGCSDVLGLFFTAFELITGSDFTTFELIRVRFHRF